MYFFALWAWWGNWYGRMEDRRQAILNQEREAMYRATGLDQIDVMTGVEFENYVAGCPPRRRIQNDAYEDHG